MHPEGLARSTAALLLAVAALIASVITAGEPDDDYLGVVYRVPVSEKVIALTFDDGLRPPFTNAILDVLRDQGIIATFFLIGENAVRHPEIARRIVREGHAIGNHGLEHTALDTLTRDGAYAEISKGAQAIRRAAGVQPRVFRPPHGALNGRITGRTGIAPDLRQTLMMWSTETRDWAIRSPLQVAAGTVRGVEPGSVVLLYDGGGNREHVVTATRWMVGHLVRQGYRFVTVPQLVDMARRP
jgi:chitin deacetylase